MRVWILLSMLFIAGCTSRVGLTPAQKDVVGRFVGDDGSFFEFTPDMKVSYQRIPASWRKPDAKEEDVISGSGIWRVQHDSVIVTVRDDDVAQPSTRKLFTFEVQGWFGLFFQIERPDGSPAFFYVPPEKRKAPNQPPEPTAPSGRGSS
jgi:hypothetical protein